MSVLSGATPLPLVCPGDHGQLLSLAPWVNCVESRAPSVATTPPAVSQSMLPALSVHRLPSISNPATGDPAAGAAPVHGPANASAAAACSMAAPGAAELAGAHAADAGSVAALSVPVASTGIAGGEVAAGDDVVSAAEDDDSSVADVEVSVGLVDAALVGPSVRVMLALVGSAGEGTAAGWSGALSAVTASISTARVTLSGSFAVEVPGASAVLGATGRLTVRMTAQGPPAMHVSPSAAAVAVSSAPSGAESATATRKEVLASSAPPRSAGSAGTSHATVSARSSSVSPPAASSPGVLRTVASSRRPERSATTRAPSATGSTAVAVSVYVMESPGSTSLPDAGSAVTVTLDKEADGADHAAPADIGTPATTRTTTPTALATCF